MIVKLLTEHHLEFLSLKGGCRGYSESTLVKMANCWKSHATAQIILSKAVLYFELLFSWRSVLAIVICHCSASLVPHLSFLNFLFR